MLNRAKDVSMRGWLHVRARCSDSAAASLLARALERRASEKEPRGGHTGQHNKTEHTKRGMCAGTRGALALAGAQTEVPRAVVTAQPDPLGLGDRGERSGGICGAAHAGQ